MSRKDDKKAKNKATALSLSLAKKKGKSQKLGLRSSENEKKRSKSSHLVRAIERRSLKQRFSVFISRFFEISALFFSVFFVFDFLIS